MTAYLYLLARCGVVLFPVVAWVGASRAPSRLRQITTIAGGLALALPFVATAPALRTGAALGRSSLQTILVLATIQLLTMILPMLASAIVVAWSARRGQRWWLSIALGEGVLLTLGFIGTVLAVGLAWPRA